MAIFNSYVKLPEGTSNWGLACLPNMAMETNGDHSPKPFDVSVEKLPLEKSVLKPKFLRIKRATQSLEGAMICQDPVDIVPSLIFNPHLFCLFCMSLSPLSKK